MTRFTRKNGKVFVNKKKYDQLIGTRAQVMHGTAFKTSGELKKHDLTKNKHGRIVSRKLQSRAKREKRLEKAGYRTRKGHFGSFHVDDKHKKTRSKKRGRKHRGGTSMMNDKSTNSMGASTGGRRRRRHSKRHHSRRHHRRHRGGMMALNPSPYDGTGEGTSGVGIQLQATNY